MKSDAKRTMLKVECAIHDDKGARLVAVDGWTAVFAQHRSFVHYLVRHVKEACLSSVLESDAEFDVDLLDVDGSTAFITAAVAGSVRIVRTFLRHRDKRPVDINRCVKVHGFMMTALNMSAAHGYDDVTRLLLDADGIEVNGGSTDESYETPLIVAVTQCCASSVQLLVDDARVNVNAQNAHGLTALHVAVSIADVDIVRMFIDRCDTTITSRAVPTDRGLTVFELSVTSSMRLFLDEWQRARRTKADDAGTRYRTVIDYRGGEVKITLQKKGDPA